MSGAQSATQTTTATARLRPCDTCRLRKTRCVRDEGQERCVLCSFHGQKCTFLRGPVPRQRRQARDQEISSSASRLQSPSSSPDQLLCPNAIRDPGVSSNNLELRSDSTTPTAPTDLIVGVGNGHTPEPAIVRPAILSDTLGLDLETHASYVGSSDYREPVLLDLRRPAVQTIEQQPPSAAPASRRLDDRTIFLVHPDETAASEAQRIADLDSIEATVYPLGRVLVDLYFRIVHPSFPILHKEVYLKTHSISHRHFAPPLLAAVYLIALDWQLYDSILAGREAIPNAAALEELAERTISQDMHRPKLSTLEAGLLLFQRSRRVVESGSNKNTSSSRTFTAQLVAMAQDLGIHLDCSSWSIPEWEKGLRRRLAWALYMQDRWGAFIHGRPFLIHDSDWDVQRCTNFDFPELVMTENLDIEGTINAQLGWDLFLRHIELSKILGDIIKTFYTAVATRSGGLLDQMGPVAATELASPLVLRLQEFYAALPESLQLTTPQLRNLCANGSLHLAYAATEITIHRALLRIVTPLAGEPLREAVRSSARLRMQAAVELLTSLRPEHTAAFWGSAASYQVAHIGSLATLLWATADSPEEMAWCTSQVDNLRWALRVRGSAAPFARESLRLLERDIAVWAWT